jgi:tRNA A-37 threonylcarbamoyl transferase component Bud32
MSVLKPGATVGGTYRVIRCVGEGAMGEVWEATHARLAGRYAIKVLQPNVATSAEALERFRREAEITSSLRHPNIVHIMDFDRLPSGAPYLVMEFLDGLDLGARLRQWGPPPIDEVVVLVGQIASALEAAHGRGVVHRDLKPQNVCLVPLAGQARSVVKVVDFGMSKIRSAAGPLTRERTLVGTVAYMSPEQASANIDEIDHRTDQFALGVMAYEMLSGRCAFNGDNEPAILFQVVHGSPPPLVLAHPATPNRRDSLAEVVGRALEKDKSRRYPSILAFALALEDASGIARVASRTRAILDSREGVATLTTSGSASGAPTLFDAAPGPMTTGADTGTKRPALRWAALVATAAFLLGTLAGGIWIARDRALRPPPHLVVAAPAPPAVIPLPPVTIAIEGLSADARVQWDRQPATAPLTMAPDGSSHHLTVETPGLAPYETEVVPDHSQTIVLLRPAPRAPVKGKRRIRPVPPEGAAPAGDIRGR